VDLQPLTRIVEFGFTVSVKRATLADEGRRFELLFGGANTALITDRALLEMWLTLEVVDIQTAEGTPLFTAHMSFEDFAQAATVLWQHNPEAFWAVHAVVREANPRWAPAQEEQEGNE
jgi:hypothetical protein